MRPNLFAFTLFLALASFAYAEDPIRPNAVLTPGVVLTTDLAKICVSGYTATVRHTTRALKHEVYVAYGINQKGGHYEIDHLIPLELGGADVKENLWPQSYETMPWNAHVKDRLEDFLHAKVCAKKLPIEQAQREIQEDWIAAYQKYFPKP